MPTSERQLNDTLFPARSVVIETNRIISLLNALFNMTVFTMMCLAYNHKRGDDVWVSSVPYSSPITILGHGDIIKTVPLVGPIFHATPHSKMTKDLMKVLGCTDILQYSPQCECFEFKFETLVLNDPTLSSQNYTRLYTSYKKESEKVCSGVRPAFTVEIVKDAGTVVFDIILLWWTFGTLVALANTYMFSTVSTWPSKYFLIGGIISMKCLSIYTFFYCTHSRIYYMAALFGIPLFFFMMVIFMTILVRRFRPQVALKQWYHFISLVDFDIYNMILTLVALPCSVRISLVLSGRNDHLETLGVMYATTFVAMLSIGVRFLRNSISNTYNDSMVISYHQSRNTENGNPDDKHYKHDTQFEGCMRALFFVSQWVWLTCVYLWVVIMIYIIPRPNPTMSTWAQCGQYSVGILLIMMVLQIPTRFQRMPFAHQNQFLFFSLSEVTARTLSSGFMIYYLFMY